MKKTTGIALLSAAALLGSAAANAAENLPWTFLEVGYIPEIGTEDDTVDAGQIRGSVGFLGRGHAQLEWTDGDIGDTGFDGYRITIGGHKNINDNTQLIVDLTYADYDLDGGEGSPSSEALGIGFGVRRAIGSQAELLAQAWYLDGETDTGFSKADFNSTFVELGGRYNWTPNFSTGLTAFIGGWFVSGDLYSSNTLRLDARWSFGNNGLSDLN